MVLITLMGFLTQKIKRLTVWVSDQPFCGCWMFGRDEMLKRGANSSEEDQLKDVSRVEV